MGAVVVRDGSAVRVRTPARRRARLRRLPSRRRAAQRALPARADRRRARLAGTTRQYRRRLEDGRGGGRAGRGIAAACRGVGPRVAHDPARRDGGCHAALHRSRETGRHRRDPQGNALRQRGGFLSRLRPGDGPRLRGCERRSAPSSSATTGRCANMGSAAFRLFRCRSAATCARVSDPRQDLGRAGSGGGHRCSGLAGDRGGVQRFGARRQIRRSAKDRRPTTASRAMRCTAQSLRRTVGDAALLCDQGRHRRPRHLCGARDGPHARVLDRDRKPIAGLYAAGNDIASVMGGNYPGGGITLGPALTFGYIAGCHLAGAAN